MKRVQETTKNTKPVEGSSGWRPLRCVCGSTRTNIFFTPSSDDDYDSEWIKIECTRCYNLLWYDGA